jgi:hypothetical protein
VVNDWKKMLAQQVRPKIIAEQKEGLKITDEKLVPGRIVEIELSEEDGLILKDGYKTRIKYIVIISVDNDRVIYASFLINSKQNDLTVELADLQYPIRYKDYPHLLKYESYLDCSFLLPIERTRLISNGKDRGKLTDADLTDAILEIRNSKTISNKEKKRFNLN